MKKTADIKAPNAIDIEVGRRIRQRRQMLGFSQSILAENLGVTFQQVQKYEKGVNRIGASRLFDLSHVLGVPIQYFYDEAPMSLTPVSALPGFAETSNDTYVADILASREGVELNKAFARIADPRVRRSIVELVKNLAGEE